MEQIFKVIFFFFSLIFNYFKHNFIILVMLAPFGLAGTLTGHVYKNMDAETSRMMDEWSHFYPVVNNNGPNDLSPAVEVLVGKS